jgi:hypothetical protein
VHKSRELGRRGNYTVYRGAYNWRSSGRNLFHVKFWPLQFAWTLDLWKDCISLTAQPDGRTPIKGAEETFYDWDSVCGLCDVWAEAE